MKKTLIKSSYKLKVFNDGSSAHIWAHPWKGWISLSSKDITNSLLWKIKIKTLTVEKKTSDLEKFTKLFK